MGDIYLYLLFYFQYFQFQIQQNNYPIFNKWIKVKLISDRVDWVKHNVNEELAFADGAFPSDEKALAVLSDFIQIPFDIQGLQKGYWANQIAFPVLKITTIDQNRQQFEWIIDANNEIINVQEISMSFKADSVQREARGMVFNPDPLTTAMVEYGGAYRDQNDADIPELNAQRQEVVFFALEKDGVYSLENQYVKIDELSIPAVAPVTTTDGVFNYTRSQSGFEDVNTYYHLTKFKEYLNSLGFLELGDFQLRVDPHALNGQDNSRVVINNGIPQMELGEGGVDDAEDADVIIHEYSHALVYHASPQSNSGQEREAMDEGFGDYLATTYSRQLSEFNWENVFSWDGHNEFYAGRDINHNKVYPDDLNNSIHLNGEIWAAALMDVWELIGKEATDSLVFSLFYEMVPGMLMPEAAFELIRLDSQLNGGKYAPEISIALFNRGLLDSQITRPPIDTTLKIEIVNSENYGNEEVQIQFSKPTNGVLELFDLQGKFIWGANLIEVTDVTIPDFKNKPFGYYYLRFTKGFERFTFPLLRKG